MLYPLLSVYRRLSRVTLIRVCRPPTKVRQKGTNCRNLSLGKKLLTILRFVRILQILRLYTQQKLICHFIYLFFWLCTAL